MFLNTPRSVISTVLRLGSQRPFKPLIPRCTFVKIRRDHIHVTESAGLQHVLASSSSTGYTVVWDLCNRCKVVAQVYGGEDQVGIIGGGGRGGMSGVA